MTDRSEMTMGEAEAWRACQAQAVELLRAMARDIGPRPGAWAARDEINVAADLLERMEPEEER
jgi:hypothetical protein